MEFRYVQMYIVTLRLATDAIVPIYCLQNTTMASINKTVFKQKYYFCCKKGVGKNDWQKKCGKVT